MNRHFVPREIALDAIFVQYERVYVSTAEVGPDFFQIIDFGPGARKELEPTYALTEEAALAGHDERLASYGYHKTGLRRWKIFRQLGHMGRAIVSVSRRPPSRKSAWLMTAVWAIAFLFPLTSVIFGGGLDFSRWVGWNNLVVGTFDGFMLYSSIKGLRWVYARTMHRA